MLNSLDQSTVDAWRWNRREWQARLKAMPDKDLHAIFVRHLNYVENSPVTRLAMIELERRGL